MIQTPSNDAIAPLEVTSSWEAVFADPARAPLERALAEWISLRRWYRTKTRRVVSAHVSGTFALPLGQTRSRLVLVDVTLDDDRRDTYVLPVTFLHGEESRALRRLRPRAVLLPLAVRDDVHVREGILADGLSVESFATELLEAFGTNAEVRSGANCLRFHGLAALHALPNAERTPKLIEREQTNTSILYGDRFVGKVVRKIDEGLSADLELGRFLTEVGFTHAPALAGYVDVVRGDPPRSPSTVALLHELVPNRGDAWEHVLGVLEPWLDEVSRSKSGPPSLGHAADLLTLATRALPAEVLDLIGPYADLARLLGQRTGEMHAALASRPADPAFCPEPLDAAKRQALALAARQHMKHVLAALRTLDGGATRRARELFHELDRRRAELDLRLDRISFLTDAGAKMRVHGDLHLGQVLFTGDDFVLIDFEGEPARTLEERRARRSPLVDVAGMLRSFDYAAWSALRKRPSEAHGTLLPWTSFWRRAVSASFLRGWLGPVDGAGVLPASLDARRVMLDFFLLEKGIYEVGYELDNRPEWLDIPLSGLVELLGPESPREVEA